MADEETTQGGNTEEQETQEQTVTAEQFAELQKQLEETRKAQSGSDRTVKQLQEQLKQKEQELQTTEKGWEQKLQEQMDTLNKKLEQAETEKKQATLRSTANDLLHEAGIKTKFVDKLLGNDEEETVQNVKDFIEEEQARLQEKDKEIQEQFAKKYGRTVTNTQQQPKDLSYNDILDMSDEQLKQLGPKKISEIINRSKE